MRDILRKSQKSDIGEWKVKWEPKCGWGAACRRGCYTKRGATEAERRLRSLRRGSKYTLFFHSSIHEPCSSFYKITAFNLRVFGTVQRVCVKYSVGVFSAA